MRTFSSAASICCSLGRPFMRIRPSAPISHGDGTDVVPNDAPLFVDSTTTMYFAACFATNLSTTARASFVMPITRSPRSPYF